MDLQAFFKISYGLYIVSACHDLRLNGYISNTVFQVTAEPAQLATCCSKQNLTCELITASKSFSISVLGQSAPATLFGLFGYKSGKDVNKFEKVNYQTGLTGSPIVLDNCIAYFECRVIQTVDLGTHLLFIGKVVESQQLKVDDVPMTYDYYREVRKGKAPKNAPTYVDPSLLKNR